MVINYMDEEVKVEDVQEEVTPVEEKEVEEADIPEEVNSDDSL